jgi:hypothetical protein
MVSLSRMVRKLGKTALFVLFASATACSAPASEDGEAVGGAQASSGRKVEAGKTTAFTATFNFLPHVKLRSESGELLDMGDRGDEIFGIVQLEAIVTDIDWDTMRARLHTRIIMSSHDDIPYLSESLPVTISRARCMCANSFAFVAFEGAETMTDRQAPKEVGRIAFYEGELDGDGDTNNRGITYLGYEATDENLRTTSQAE